MGDQRLTDFVVDSNGFCFLCLSKIFHSHVTPKDGSSSIQSLQYLSRYLKIDMTRVFNEADAITPELLTKVERSRLKVELCEECASLNETFSKLYRQLERIEMGVKSCVNLIKSKLSNVKKNNAKADYQFGMNSVDGFHGKLRIFEMLRTETEEKCSMKLGPELPRIKLQKLSLKQAHRKILKMKSSPRVWEKLDHVPLDNVSAVNTEINYSNSDPLMDDDNDANRYFDDNFDESAEQEAEQVTRKYINDMAVEQEGTAPTTSATAKPRITIDKSVYTINPETGKYQCNLCGKEIKNFRCFKRHYEGLHLKIRYKCSMCGKELQNKANYNRHVQTEHLKIKFKCQGCGNSYTEKYTLKKHQRLKRCGRGISAVVKNEADS